MSPGTSCNDAGVRAMRCWSGAVGRKAAGPQGTAEAPHGDLSTLQRCAARPVRTDALADSSGNWSMRWRVIMNRGVWGLHRKKNYMD